MRTAANSEQANVAGVAPDAFRKAMRNFAGTVALVTSGQGTSRRGLTITAVCSLSVDPPSVLICINRKAEAHAVIKHAGVFGISVLAPAHAELARTFSGQDGTKGLDRFLHGRWTEMVTKAPLLEDAVANLDCQIINAVDVGTHTVFYGLVVATHEASASRPLIHYDGGFAALAEPH